MPSFVPSPYLRSSYCEPLCSARLNHARQTITRKVSYTQSSSLDPISLLPPPTIDKADISSSFPNDVPRLVGSRSLLDKLRSLDAESEWGWYSCIWFHGGISYHVYIGHISVSVCLDSCPSNIYRSSVRTIAYRRHWSHVCRGTVTNLFGQSSSR